MKKFFTLIIMGALLLSCEKTWHNDSPIDTAVAASFSNLTSSTVTISLTATNEVASYLVTDPALADAVAYLAMDAIERLAYIQEHGRESDAPYEKSYSTLSASTTYAIGFVACKADGTICSAPTFSTFTTTD
ncbi:MAG: hypothetical protein ACOXZI_00080 [Candidatus Cryptobacteroides sp.]|jgi:hypothetical protein